MKIRPGGWAWIGLPVGIVAVDYWLIKTDNATMSMVFGDALDHPIKRWPVIVAGGIVVAHLYGRFLPYDVKKFDPISGLARALTKEH